jgi:hypothetical protein
MIVKALVLVVCGPYINKNIILIIKLYNYVEGNKIMQVDLP